jgi:hypothetical protein
MRDRIPRPGACCAGDRHKDDYDCLSVREPHDLGRRRGPGGEARK